MDKVIIVVVVAVVLTALLYGVLGVTDSHNAVSQGATSIIGYFYH